MPAQPLLACLRRPGGWRRAWLVAVLAFALALKLLVPSGWMPGPSGGLVLCPDALPTAHATAMHHHGGDKAPAHTAPDHPCAFAGLGLAATPALSIVAVAPPPAPVSGIAPARHFVAVGRGLAAPPPPATGPPDFA